MADRVVKFREISSILLVLAGFLVVVVLGGGAQLPSKVKCVDQHCQEHIGVIRAPQNYASDDYAKLSFNIGDRLLVLGDGGDNFYLVKDVGRNKVGLVGKHFIRRLPISKQPNIEVDLSSLLRADDGGQVESSPTPEPSPTSAKCIIDGTAIEDPDLCDKMSAATTTIAQQQPDALRTVDVADVGVDHDQRKAPRADATVTTASPTPPLEGEQLSPLGGSAEAPPVAPPPQPAVATDSKLTTNPIISAYKDITNMLSNKIGLHLPRFINQTASEPSSGTSEDTSDEFDTAPPTKATDNSNVVEKDASFDIATNKESDTANHNSEVVNSGAPVSEQSGTSQPDLERQDDDDGVEVKDVVDPSAVDLDHRSETGEAVQDSLNAAPSVGTIVKDEDTTPLSNRAENSKELPPVVSEPVHMGPPSSLQDNPASGDAKPTMGTIAKDEDTTPSSSRAENSRELPPVVPESVHMGPPSSLQDSPVSGDAKPTKEPPSTKPSHEDTGAAIDAALKAQSSERIAAVQDVPPVTELNPTVRDVANSVNQDQPSARDIPEHGSEAITTEGNNKEKNCVIGGGNDINKDNNRNTAGNYEDVKPSSESAHNNNNRIIEGQPKAPSESAAELQSGGDTLSVSVEQSVVAGQSVPSEKINDVANAPDSSVETPTASVLRDAKASDAVKPESPASQSSPVTADADSVVRDLQGSSAALASPPQAVDTNRGSPPTPPSQATPELREPRVIVGLPPSSLSQPNIHATKTGPVATRFRTRPAHGHSHGGHGHSHGGHAHSHAASHGHNHDDHGHGSHDHHGHSHGAHEHVGADVHHHSHNAGPPEPDPLQGHSYPGQKPAAPVPSAADASGGSGSTSTEVAREPGTVEVESNKPAPAGDNVVPMVGRPEYKENTAEQTCERNDGIACSGEDPRQSSALRDDNAHSKAHPKETFREPAKRKPHDDTADSVIRDYVGLVLSVVPEPLHSLLWEFEDRGVSSHVVVLTFLCGLLGAFLIMFFTCISQTSKEGALSDYIARLEQQIFALKKEREILLEGKDSTLVAGTTPSDSGLSEELAERHARELEAVQARANQTEQDAIRLQDAVDKLQVALRSAQESLAESEATREAEREDFDLQQQEVAEELTELRILIEENDEVVKSKDKELRALTETNAQILQEAQIWDQRVKELTARVETDTEAMNKLQKDYDEKCTEVEALQETLKALNVLEKAQDAAGDVCNEDVMRRLVDVQRARQLSDELSTKNAALLQEVSEARDQLNKWRVEIEQLKESLQQALTDKQESEQKLSVLSEYFKEKELKLQRDVVMQETLRQQKESDALSVSEQLALYREENANLQSQSASLKEELEVSERKYKRQLMEQEKRAHDNWMAFKNSTKTIEELQAEMQVLRQQLVMQRADRETAERAAALPQDRPRPPPPLPPLPLPKGVQMPLPLLPLPNGLSKAGEMPSPPMSRYMEGVRRTPPAGVSLPSVLYQTKSGSSRHSSDGRSVRSSGSKSGAGGGGIGAEPTLMSPDLRRTSTTAGRRRSDRSGDPRISERRDERDERSPRDRHLR